MSIDGTATPQLHHAERVAATDVDDVGGSKRTLDVGVAQGTVVEQQWHDVTAQTPTELLLDDRHVARIVVRRSGQEDHAGSSLRREPNDLRVQFECPAR